MHAGIMVFATDYSIHPAELAKAGRNPDDIEVTVYACPADKDLVQRYADAGITRVVFGAPPAGSDVALGYFDHLADIAALGGVS